MSVAKIFIDADACPVTRDALAIARRHSVPVALVANESQNLGQFAHRAGVEILQVGSGRECRGLRDGTPAVPLVMSSSRTTPDLRPWPSPGAPAL